ALNLSVGDNADLLVTDGAGRRTGFDVTTGTVLREIPNSFYYRDSLEDDETDLSQIGTDHSVEISQPSQGVYTVTLIRQTQGTYAMSLRSYAQDATTQQYTSITGNINVGETKSIQVQSTQTPSPTP